MFRVIVAGGRDFEDYALLQQTMDRLLVNVQDRIVIVCGRARGADSLGERYAQEHGHSVRTFPADWDRYGRAAGFIRNEEMAKNADALVAFWDGQSRGTQNMIEVARRYQLKIRVIRY